MASVSFADSSLCRTARTVVA
ncbi:hypothetical protein AVEN_78414-1, partial [Araneus ventricosus]